MFFSLRFVVVKFMLCRRRFTTGKEMENVSLLFTISRSFSSSDFPSNRWCVFDWCLWPRTSFSVRFLCPTHKALNAFLSTVFSTVAKADFPKRFKHFDSHLCVAISILKCDEVCVSATCAIQLGEMVCSFSHTFSNFQFDWRHWSAFSFTSFSATNFCILRTSLTSQRCVKCYHSKWHKSSLFERQTLAANIYLSQQGDSVIDASRTTCHMTLGCRHVREKQRRNKQI